MDMQTSPPKKPFKPMMIIVSVAVIVIMLFTIKHLVEKNIARSKAITEAKQDIPKIVEALALYKQSYGEYPDNLYDLSTRLPSGFNAEMLGVSSQSKNSRMFFYVYRSYGCGYGINLSQEGAFGESGDYVVVYEGIVNKDSC